MADQQNILDSDPPSQTRGAVVPVDASKRSLGRKVWRSVARAVREQPNMAVDLADLMETQLPGAVGTEIINICNADCSFCGYGKGEKGKAADPRRKGKLQEDVYHHTLKLYDRAGGGTFSLSPILGEVSAHPKWLEMVRAARRFPNITGVTCFTNAILLDRFGSKEILTSGLTHMNISTCLSSAEEYNRLYGVDRYEKVVSNVFDLLQTNSEIENPISLDILLRMDKPFAPFFESEIYQRLLEYLKPERISILDDDWDDFHGIVPATGIPQGHVFKDTSADKTLPCYALFRKLQVLTDGTVQGCSCRIEPELWAGNILDYESLEEVWRGPGLQRLRNDWFAGNIPDCCTKCSHYAPLTNLLRKGEPSRVARTFLRRAKARIMSVIG
jgi:hypothetical protein